MITMLTRQAGLKFVAATAQLSAFNEYTMNLCGSGSPGAGLTAKGVWGRSIPLLVYPIPGFGVSIRAGFRVRD